MSNKKFVSMNGKGYIALLLCAAAIGISGYMFYRNQNHAPLKKAEGTPISQEIVTEPGGVEAAATKPSEPPVSVKPEKKESVKGKLKTAAPVSGEKVADYAVDCLSYNATTRDWRTHNGVDYAAEAGTQVKAAAEGIVYTVYEDDTMGMTVVIRHEGGYITKYASLAPEIPVKAGDSVKLGQTIGCVGKTALLESALGDHVHFSVTCQDEPMDPAQFLSLE